MADRYESVTFGFEGENLQVTAEVVSTSGGNSWSGKLDYEPSPEAEALMDRAADVSGKVSTLHLADGRTWQIHVMALGPGWAHFNGVGASPF